MADLLDILPDTSVESVKIGNQFAVVHGLNAKAVGSIVARFPHLATMLRGIDLGPKLLEQLGAAVAPVIAAGFGKLGDEQYERHAETAFLIEDQLRLATAILRLTFPNGVGSFVKTMVAGLTDDEGAKKPIKMRVKPGPSISPDSSAVVSPLITQ